MLIMCTNCGRLSEAVLPYSDMPFEEIDKFAESFKCSNCEHPKVSQ